MYNYILDGQTVALRVLVNADASLVGLKFENCEIKTLTVREMANLIVRTYGKHEVAVFYETISSRLPPEEKRPDDTSTSWYLDDVNLVVLEEVGGDGFVGMEFLKSIQLLNSIDLYYCYFMNYRFEDGQLKWGGRSDVVDFSKRWRSNAHKFSMSNEENVNSRHGFDNTNRLRWLWIRTINLQKH